MPRAAILWPQRRSIVSSMPITIGPLGKNLSRIISSSLRPRRRCSIAPGCECRVPVIGERRGDPRPQARRQSVRRQGPRRGRRRRRERGDRRRSPVRTEDLPKLERRRLQDRHTPPPLRARRLVPSHGHASDFPQRATLRSEVRRPTFVRPRLGQGLSQRSGPSRTVLLRRSKYGGFKERRQWLRISSRSGGR